MMTKKETNQHETGSLGGRKGIYTVTWGETPYDGGAVSNISKNKAVKLAQELASKRESAVTVSFYRAPDGQVGYLDQEGNHSPVGQHWKHQTTTNQ